MIFSCLGAGEPGFVLIVSTVDGSDPEDELSEALASR